MKLKFYSVLASVFILFFLNINNLAAQGFHSVSSKLLLETATTWNGDNITYPEGIAKITALKIEIEPGAETGWHHHPVPSFAYILQGELEITLKDGRKMTASAGEAVAEVTNTFHNGKNIGHETLKLIVFYTGIEGGTLTILKDSD